MRSLFYILSTMAGLCLVGGIAVLSVGQQKKTAYYWRDSSKRSAAFRGSRHYCRYDYI